MDTFKKIYKEVYKLGLETVSAKSWGDAEWESCMNKARALNKEKNDNEYCLKILLSTIKIAEYIARGNIVTNKKEIKDFYVNYFLLVTGEITPEEAFLKILPKFHPQLEPILAINNNRKIVIKKGFSGGFSMEDFKTIAEEFVDESFDFINQGEEEYDKAIEEYLSQKSEFDWRMDPRVVALAKKSSNYEICDYVKDATDAKIYSYDGDESFIIVIKGKIKENYKKEEKVHD
ncbi:MAG: hypothetical protein PUB67_01415 [Clostridiales bacterium]|nr:hypothetical protein [Clostridiales bacterium]